MAYVQEQAQVEDSMREAQMELVDIINRAYRVLDDDQVGMLCWGCGIDPRLISKPLNLRYRGS
jgi:hypothetical protein